MAPPGRRRAAGGISLLLYTLLFFLSSFAAAQSVVLGIDIGTEYIKAAVVKPGIPLEIVLSKDSKRKEAVSVAFKTPKQIADGQFPERSYGSDAIALTARFPGDVYSNLKALLGLPIDGSTVVANYLEAYPALDLMGIGPRKTAAFKSPSFGSKEPPFSVEEILAMELKNIKENTQVMVGKGYRVENAVFTIPAFYTAEERKAIILAADLAGLKALSLVTDGMAVGINYATTRTFADVEDGGKPEIHMILDVGAGSTTATVIRFEGRQIPDAYSRGTKSGQFVVAMGTGWDRTLGGDALNRIIVNDMVEKFVASPGVKALGREVPFSEVRKHGRTAARLWRDAEKARQVLSANLETVASFEGLYENVDFKYKITRAEFEESAAEFAERLDAPVKQALKAANLSMSDIDSIILHGGASRTPFIQKRLETLAGNGKKLRTNVNADEAAVFGAAFRAARLSRSFKVKEIFDSDVAQYGVWLRHSDGKEADRKIFGANSGTGRPHQVEFPTVNEDFSFNVYQSLGAGNLGAAPSDGAANLMITTKNLTKSYKELIDKHGCKAENITHSWTVQIEPMFGLPYVPSGSVSCSVLVEDKKGGILDDAKGFFGFGKKDDKQQALTDGEGGSFKASLKTSPKSSSTSSSASSKSESAPDAKATTATEGPIEPELKTISIKIAFDTVEVSLNTAPTEFVRMKERISSFDSSDQTRLVREEAFNTLESFSYKVRDYISEDAFGVHMSDDQKTSLEKLQRETASWIGDDEAQSATSDTLKGRLKGLRELVVPALQRKEDAVKQPEMIKMLRSAMSSTQSFIDVVRQSIESAKEAEANLASELAASSSSAAAAEAEAASSKSAAGEDSAKATDIVDPLADLEEDKESTTISSAETQPTRKPSTFSPYSAADLESLVSIYEKANEWLESRIKKQEGLKPYENSPFDSQELQMQTLKMNEALMSLFNRRSQESTDHQKSKSGKSSSKGKGKKSKKTKKGDKASESKTADGKKSTQTKSKVAESTGKKDEL